MYELIYSSIETRAMQDADLLDVLNEAREKNERLGITGLLFYYNREFVQILEGERDTVISLFKTILGDERHRGVELFWDADIEARSFEDWSMGFASKKEGDLLEKLGYVDFITNGKSSLKLTEHPSEGRNMMIKLRDIILKGY